MKFGNEFFRRKAAKCFRSVTMLVHKHKHTLSTTTHLFCLLTQRFKWPFQRNMSSSLLLVHTAYIGPFFVLRRFFFWKIFFFFSFFFWLAISTISRLFGKFFSSQVIVCILTLSPDSFYSFPLIYQALLHKWHLWTFWDVASFTFVLVTKSRL